jgi:hypothetical protein
MDLVNSIDIDTEIASFENVLLDLGYTLADLGADDKEALICLVLKWAENTAQSFVHTHIGRDYR